MTRTVNAATRIIIVKEPAMPISIFVEFAALFIVEL
jgi:hypothetical protein